MSRLVLAAAAVMCVGIFGVVSPAPGGAEPTVSAATGLGAGGEFHALGPIRVFDSRPATAINDPKPGKKRMNASGGFDVALDNQFGLPAASDVLAVVVNVTVVEPEASGWLSARPKGGSGTSALVTFPAGRNVPNVGIIGLGTGGKLTITLGPTQNANAHVVIDLFGWISKSAYTGAEVNTGARLVPSGPARLVDTRRTGNPLGAGRDMAVQIRGANSYDPVLKPAVPNSGSVTAALVNIAAVNNRGASTSTFVSASPNKLKLPVRTANLNVVRGQIKTNLAIVPVGSDGKIHLYNHAGQIDLIVDLFGYFEVKNDADATTAGRVVPLASPFRVLDTRKVAFGSAPLGSGTMEDWSFSAFTKSVTLPGGQTAQSALIGNLTGTNLGRVYPSVAASTYLTAFPTNPKPRVSNLNLSEGEVVSNMSLMRYDGADKMRIYNNYGSVHYVLDVFAIVLE